MKLSMTAQESVLDQSNSGLLNLFFIIAPSPAKCSCGYFFPNCYYPHGILITGIYYVSVYVLWAFGRPKTTLIFIIFFIYYVVGDGRVCGENVCPLTITDLTPSSPLASGWFCSLESSTGGGGRAVGRK